MKRKIIIYLFTSMLAVTLHGQAEQEVIHQTFDHYFETVKQKNNEQTLDYIYPKLFDYYPRELMLDAMNGMSADTTIIISMDHSSVGHISESIEMNGVKYAMINYSFEMTMVMKQEDIEVGDEDDMNPADWTYEILKETYGEDHIAYDRENSTMVIQVASEMYAIHSVENEGWKFLENKETMKPVMEKLLPKEILEKW